MKKLTLLLFLSGIFLIGCGKVDRMISSYTGAPSEVCYQGVIYLQFTSGSSVKYTTDGKIALCGK